MPATLAKRYESLSLRERAMVSFAILGAAIFLWDSLFMDPLRLRRMAFEAELSSATAAGVVASSVDPNDPRQVNLQRAAELQTQVHTLDARIASTAIGFVSAEKMVQALYDVLDRQGRLQLVSIRNLPVVSLAPPKPADPNGEAPAAAPTPDGEPSVGPPPYVHSIELFIDGEYADVVTYLEALEKLPYRFRWNSLELRTRGYPLNRVRIQLSTISLDANWLGV
jgi:MSHA biogenesis protein MshJ